MQVYVRPRHKQVKIVDGFWKEVLDKIHTVTVFDVLEKFEKDHDEGIMKNYEWVAEGKTGKHIGPPWYDGLICEVIRALSDIIAHTYDKKLDDKILEYAQKIDMAQQKSGTGYLNTYVTLLRPGQEWGVNGGDMIWTHDTYNLGCIIEAGVHHYLATGKMLMLKCAVNAANCMSNTMGYAPKMNITPAHSLAEEAVLKLAALFKEEPGLQIKLKDLYKIEARPDDYVALVKFWMDHKGVHHNRGSLPKYMGEYAQDHCRIEDQSEAVGHAVRAALMYTGLAALGVETADNKYLDAAKRIWKNIVETKLHISGGIGAVHNEERFGFQYHLPNDAYLETCAGVALCFFAGEMFRAFGEASYFDVFERALFNNVLPGLSVDGTKYFYENPLMSDGTVERWDWHGCPCCPPMFLKLMAALPDYVYAIRENEVYINLHIASTLVYPGEAGEIIITQKNCGLPYQGSNAVVVKTGGPAALKIAVRIPEWAGECSFSLNNAQIDCIVDKGYAIFDRVWDNGDTINIEMTLPVLKMEAHPYVAADAGLVALQRGPLLYCLEACDNDGEVDIELDASLPQIVPWEMFEDCMKMTGKTSQRKDFTAIPYYLWCNRDKGAMAVWIRQKDSVSYETKRNNIKGWEGKLYKEWRSQ